MLPSIYLPVYHELLGGHMDLARLPHYHIRWYDQAVLDWERFSTPEDATARAKLLACPGEGYAVEEHDGACPRCRDMMNLKFVPGTSKGASA